MNARRRWMLGNEPVLGLSPTTTRRLHRFAFVWSLAAIVTISLAGRLDLLDTRPGRTSFPITIQPVFMVMFAVGVIVAVWSEIVGGTIAAFTAAGLAVFAAEQLEPMHAAAVVTALLIPGLAWILIDLHDFRPAVAGLALAMIAVAVAGGAVIAKDAYDDLFGPAHPESTTEADELPVDWAWVGGVTSERATIVVRTSDDDPMLRVDPTGAQDAADADDPAIEVIARPVGDDIVRFDVGNLRSDTDYEYAVRARPGGAAQPIGRFRTFPSEPASFTVAVGSCARTGSNGAVFDAIHEVEPLLYLMTGDIHYGDIDDGNRDDMIEVMDLTLSQPAPSTLYRSTSVAYVWDDHDFGGNGSDSTSPSREAAQDVYRTVVPHYPLPASDGGIEQAFTIGRIRFVLTDVRSDRTPSGVEDDADASMLGAEQRAWLEREIIESSATHAAVVWVNPVPWIAEQEHGAGHWGGYVAERAALADTIAEHGIDNLLMVSGDAHMLAIDDGTNSDFSTVGGGGFPVLHAAALDRPGSVKGGPYSVGEVAGAGQFATISVQDDGGSEIVIELVGRDWTGAELMSHVITFDASR